MNFLHCGDTCFWREKKKCKLKIRKKIPKFWQNSQNFGCHEIDLEKSLEKRFFFRSAHSKAHGNSIRSELHRKPTTGFFSKHSTGHDIPRTELRRKLTKEVKAQRMNLPDRLLQRPPRRLRDGVAAISHGRADKKYLTLPIKILQ